jgi:hypothetical protein
MSGLFDAFWRAAAYCLHPRVMLLSLAPVLLAGGAVLGLGWWFWGDAVDGVQTALSHWTLSDAVLRWLESMGFQSVRAFLVPMILVLAAVPMVVMLSLLLGTPVLTSNTASLPEVVGDAALTIDPYDTRALAEGIQALDGDENLRAELSWRGPRRAALFDGDAYGRRLAEMYGKLGITLSAERQAEMGEEATEAEEP